MGLYYFSPKLTYSADPNSIGIYWSLELLLYILDNSVADGMYCLVVPSPPMAGQTCSLESSPVQRY